MGFEDLSEAHQINGIFTLIFISISIIVGLRILLKYISLKRKELFTIGLAWIFLTSAWWGGIASFFSIILFDKPLDAFPFLLLSNMFTPVALICWIYSLLHIFYEEKEKIVSILFLIIYSIYDILILSLLFIDPSLVGEIVSDINSRPTLFPQIFMLSAIITALFTGLLFSIKSIAVDDPEVKLKGKILFIAFISFSFAAVLDAIISDITLILILIRLILISSAIEYNLGFFLPKFLSNKLNKKKK
ncbi:MAG: hypothetical protein KGD57_02690 [Candidatus Lokiarchaeota archaeon]|nr:hypothetical protein [Candidatus Lokiarchaeota archaeon]